MSEDNSGSYGYEDDGGQQSGGLSFGLNAGVTNMVKFEFNPNGGKDGAEGEALDVVFNINGKDVSYRMFPVTKTFDKNNVEITDPRHPEMKRAMKEFNAVIVHILHAFVSKETLKVALGVPIGSFKQFCNVATNVLPKNFNEVNLDIFAQWQWQLTGDNNKTYLRLPKNMKHGKWVCPHIPPVGGEWEELRLNGALSYKDTDGNKHPFSRQKWFMESNFAEQQAEDEGLESIDTGAHTTGTGTEVSSTEWEA